MTTPRNERGIWVLNAYAENYYPGAEDTEDPDGAFSVAADIMADLLHALDSLGHRSPESAVSLALTHYVEELEGS